MTQDEILAEIKKHPDGIFRKDLVKKMGNSLQISQLRKKKLIYVFNARLGRRFCFK